MSQWQVDKKGNEVLVAKTERPTKPAEVVNEVAPSPESAVITQVAEVTPIAQGGK